MSLLAQAPALAILGAWGTALASVRLGASPGIASAAGGLCALGLLLWGQEAPPAPGSRSLGILVLLLSLGGSWWVARGLTEVPFLPPRLDEAGRVLAERPWGMRRVALADLPSGRFFLYLPRGLCLEGGETIRVRGGPRPFPPPRSPGDFDQEAYWRSRGALGVLETGLVELLGPPGPWRAWRNGVHRRILLNLPPRMRGYLLAAWLGRRDPELGAQHGRWGTSHILAVSGFHVALVVGAAHLLLRRVPGREIWESLLLWGYVLLAGAPASALRAGAMIQLVLLGRLLGRPSGAFNLLCAAAGVLLAFRPWLFLDLGFQLSVLSVLVLTSWTWLPPVLLPLVGPLVWLVTAPLTASVFGSVPLAGIPLNFLALPFFSCFFPLASLLALPALAGLPGGIPVAWMGELLAAGFEIAAEGIATYLPGGVPFSPTLAALAATAGAFGALRAASCSPRRSLWGALVLGGSVLAWSMRGLTGV